MAQGTLVVRVLADTKQIESMSSKMMSLGGKLSLGLTAPLAILGKTAVSAGSDLEETLSKANTIFGESGREIEKWAEGAAQAFGQSKEQALDAAATFGNMFTQLGLGEKEAAQMSRQMTELASDFASFHNADITDVLDAQAAAFRGEYDSVQRFVPTINAAAVQQKALEMGLAETTKELTEQDKVLATQRLLLEGAGDAAGDFARTSDSLANSQRRAAAEAANAQASLGEGLLPITQKLTEWAGKLGAAFGGLSSGWQTTILVAGGLLAALGPIITVIGSLSTVVGVLSKAMLFLAANPIVLAIAGIAALGVALVVAYKKSETFRNIVDGAFSAVARAIELYTLPARKAIEAIIEVIQRAIRMIRRLVNAAKDIPGAGILGKVSGIAGAVGGALGKLPGFANGVSNFRGGYAVVGERGPEVVRLPRGSDVIPNHKLGGAIITVNVNAQGVPASEVADVAARTIGWRLGLAGGL